jgi:hypothetical protein
MLNGTAPTAFIADGDGAHREFSVGLSLLRSLGETEAVAEKRRRRSRELMALTIDALQGKMTADEYQAALVARSARIEAEDAR